MLIDLDKYFKIDFLKKDILRSGYTISDINEVDRFVNRASCGILNKDIHTCIIFERSTLKNYCLSKLKNKIDYTVINCTSNIERFSKDLSNVSGMIIFDNVNRCKDLNILKIVESTESIIIC